jgi:Protein of unknown function (DUF2911)
MMLQLNRNACSGAVAGIALVLLPNALAAQMRASERGAVSQTVDGTTITVEFSRPRAHGRVLFGGEVPWGKVWTGANWATTIDVNRDITIGGHPLPHGKYSVWLQVQPDEWTTIFDPEPHRFHTNPPKESAEQVRFTVTPGTGPHVEALTWSFPEYRATATTLQMAWGTTTVSLPIEVEPSRPLTVSAELAARYTGTFRMAPHGRGRTETTIELRYEGEHLVAHWENPPNPRLAAPWLVSLGEGMFIPVELEDGKPFDVLSDLVFEFTPLDGQATHLELRVYGDQWFGTAERVR